MAQNISLEFNRISCVVQPLLISITMQRRAAILLCDVNTFEKDSELILLSVAEAQTCQVASKWLWDDVVMCDNKVTQHYTAGLLGVYKGGLSHGDVTHWCVNTRSEAYRLVSRSAPSGVSSSFCKLMIPYLQMSNDWSASLACPPTPANL